MKHCTHCGHRLGFGRFCTNCGAPVATRPDPLTDPTPPETDEDWRQNTAERPRPVAEPAPPKPVAPSVPPTRVPPVVAEAPPPPRFPLFADEVVPPTAVPPPTAAAATPPPAPTPVAVLDEPTDWDDDEGWDEDWDEGRPRWTWAVLAVVVLAALVAGAWFLGQKVSGDDGDDKAEDPAASGEAEPGTDDGGTGGVDHTAEASADAPRTAEPNQDVDGNPTSYDASNMLDGVPGTAWRVEGDASGMKIVFTFAEKTRITQVGLVNGYAKKARDGGKVLDWYEGHRRIQQVTWILSGGQSVRQDLSDDRELQTVDVDPVEVTKVVLRIAAVSEPGDGAASRDFTAISDVFLGEG